LMAAAVHTLTPVVAKELGVVVHKKNLVEIVPIVVGVVEEVVPAVEPEAVVRNTTTVGTAAIAVAVVEVVVHKLSPSYHVAVAVVEVVVVIVAKAETRMILARDMAMIEHLSQSKYLMNNCYIVVVEVVDRMKHLPGLEEGQQRAVHQS